jgi:Type VI secretion system/phage-baseplate injector OB domain
VNRRRLVGAASGLLTGLLVVGVAAAETPRALGLRAIVAGSEIPASVRYDIVVDDEVGGAPTARLTLTRAEAVIGDDVQVIVHPGGATIFRGEIVGIEPVVGPDGDPLVLIRAVFVDDRRLAVQPIDPDAIVLGPLRVRPAVGLRLFHPQLSSSDTVQQVVIRGRTADGTPVTGQASVPTLWLVPERDDPHTIVGRTSEIVVETPLASADAAAALAREGLDLLVAERVSAETLADGSASLRSGRLVVVQGANARFDGQYYVKGVSHRYTHPQSGDGYHAVLRLLRADGGIFFLPDIDDEVLVAFEHGDLRRPVVVGSLWDSEDCPPPCRDCPPSCDAALH